MRGSNKRDTGRLEARQLEANLRRHGRDLLADGLVQPRRRGGLAQHLGHLGRGGGGGGPSGDLFGVRHCDGDEVGLERVAVHKQLREQRAAQQHRLDLLRGDVLAYLLRLDSGTGWVGCTYHLGARVRPARA